MVRFDNYLGLRLVALFQVVWVCVDERQLHLHLAGYRVYRLYP